MNHSGTMNIKFSYRTNIAGKHRACTHRSHGSDLGTQVSKDQRVRSDNCTGRLSTKNTINQLVHVSKVLGTYCTLRQPVGCHYRKEVEEDRRESWRHLENINTSWRTFRNNLTNKAPGIASLMNFHTRGDDIGCVAEVGQPHILHVKVIEGFVKRAVKFVTL